MVKPNWSRSRKRASCKGQGPGLRAMESSWIEVRHDIGEIELPVRDLNELQCVGEGSPQGACERPPRMLRRWIDGRKCDCTAPGNIEIVECERVRVREEKVNVGRSSGLGNVRRGEGIVSHRDATGIG